MKLMVSREAAAEIADRASSGEFGDTEDWLAAEGRWSRGVSIDDIESFDRNGGVIGTFLREAGVVQDYGNSVTHMPELGKVLTELLSLWPRLRVPKVRAEIGSNLLFIAAAYTGFAGGPNLTVTPQNILEFAESVTAYDINETVDLGAVVLLASVSQSPKEWLSVCDKIGIMPRISYWSRRPDKTNHITSVMRDAFVADTSRRGLARILAEMAQASAKNIPAHDVRIPLSLLENLDWKETEFRRAQIQLCLAQREVSPERAARLAEEVAANERGATGFVDECLSIAKGMLDTSALESFVIGLSRFLQPSDWETRSHVMDAIDEILRERRSKLHDPDVRSDLQLPGPVT